MKFSEEEKAMWLEDWRQGGKSAWAYAKANGLHPQTFTKWTKAGMETERCFVEVPVPVMPSTLCGQEILIEKGEIMCIYFAIGNGSCLRRCTGTRPDSG